ncbi:hypothetical protein B0H17DRAFT_1180210 [Mycena rosella]|uniref:Uncharacterized protein n=1 Tax=Mycena rosella TaxID=1033263 RepID=A0AAD7DEG6_MYCRO|nr:hypothetical protein B0H17DRAFT_1180210 [Mycena rosella]
MNLPSGAGALPLPFTIAPAVASAALPVTRVAHRWERPGFPAQDLIPCPGLEAPPSGAFTSPHAPVFALGLPQPRPSIDLSTAKIRSYALRDHSRSTIDGPNISASIPPPPPSVFAVASNGGRDFFRHARTPARAIQYRTAAPLLIRLYRLEIANGKIPIIPALSTRPILVRHVFCEGLHRRCAAHTHPIPRSRFFNSQTWESIRAAFPSELLPRGAKKHCDLTLGSQPSSASNRKDRPRRKAFYEGLHRRCAAHTPGHDLASSTENTKFADAKYQDIRAASQLILGGTKKLPSVPIEGA